MRNFKQLTQAENKRISQLDYHPEDASIDVVHTFKSTEAKILAISIYDWWRGAVLFGNFEGMSSSRDIYKKLFNKNVATLFNIDQPVFGEHATPETWNKIVETFFDENFENQ